VDGFAVGDPEIVFKFPHPDLQTAAEMDVRPMLVEALTQHSKLSGVEIGLRRMGEVMLGCVDSKS
jgi:hypothetical protein